MMTALAQQPVSVAIEADQSSFQLYKSGVFTGSCGTNLDHGVLLVGYGTMNGLDYYIMKNSWGSSSWGDQGYMYMGKGNDPASGKPYNGGKGQCGVLMQGVYPVI
jgi:C1A family cysteine protease